MPLPSPKRVAKAKAQPREGGKFARRQYGPVEGAEPPEWVAMRIGDGAIREATDLDRPAPRLRREVIVPTEPDFEIEEGEIEYVRRPRLVREVVNPPRTRRQPRRHGADDGTSIEVPWFRVLASLGVLGAIGWKFKKFHAKGLGNK